MYKHFSMLLLLVIKKIIFKIISNSSIVQESDKLLSDKIPYKTIEVR